MADIFFLVTREKLQGNYWPLATVCATALGSAGASEIVYFFFSLASLDGIRGGLVTREKLPEELLAIGNCVCYSALGSAGASEIVYFFFSLASLDGIRGGRICF
jgi:hypothetical protein